MTAWADKRGKSREEQGYGRAHKAMRAHLIATVTLCEECRRNGRATPGTHADHIKPKAQGGTDDRDNYQLLCAPCHDEKSRRERGHKIRPVIGVDGWPTNRR